MLATFVHANTSTRLKAITSGTKHDQQFGRQRNRGRLRMQENPCRFAVLRQLSVMRWDQAVRIALALDDTLATGESADDVEALGMVSAEKSGPSCSRPAMVRGAQKSRGTSLIS